MTFNKKKTALIAGTCLAVLLGGAPAAWAAPMESALEAAQKAERITGTVYDESGEPLIGVNVVVKGEKMGVNTDFDGRFVINAAPGQTLVFSYVGYNNLELKLGNQKEVTVTLIGNTTVLDEVVAVGYGVQKKKLVTGSTVQVSGEQIAGMNTTNALTAMQSTSPGVQITQSSTQPGKGFKVNIRGMGTIGESSPLLIIDGVNAGTANDGLNGLNPNDIESIDILKDAASAAIYGARAANGVILVTTKQGKAGKVSVQYDGFVGVANPYRVPGTLGAKQYMQVVNETYFNTTGEMPNWPGLVPQAILDKVAGGWEGTDWFELFRNKNALQTSHAVSITGGSEKGHFSIGINYSKNEGTMGRDNASNYERYGGRINSEWIIAKLNGHDFITFGENVSFWYHGSHDLAEGNGYWSITQPLYSTSPLVPAFNEEGGVGNFIDNGAGFSTMIYSNPLNGFVNGQFNSLNKNRDFGVGATFYWIIEPIKNLRYRGQLNTGFSGSNNRNATKPYAASSTSQSANYGLGQSSSQGSSLTFENTISYILPEFGKNHIDVLVGQSIERQNWSTGMSMSFSDSPDNLNSLVYNGWDYTIASNFSNMTGYSGYDNPKAGNIASFFGRVNYNFDEKYLLTAILRADGANKFARGHRWGTYPSVSAGWVVTNESFMEPIHDTMDFLKIRASWGQNGNCNIPNFMYLSNIGFSPTDYADYGYKFGSSMEASVTQGMYTTGAYAKNVPNPDVAWETSEQLDLGFDARFLQSRLGVTFDWYKKTTKDWLVAAPMNDIFGYEEPATINGGDVQNTGVEIALSWNDNIGEFNYFVNVNAAYNKNKVTRLATASGKIGDDITSALFQNSSYVSLVEVGHPIGYFSGMSYSGIWQNQDQIDKARAEGKAVLPTAQPGDMIWDDWNKDGSIDEAGDRHQIGNPNPDWTMGVTLGFNWRGFDFSAAGSGAFGHQIMQCYRTALLANYYLNFTPEVMNRWHGEGTSNTYPRLVQGTENNKWVSTLYMQNADYFKLQNVTIGYDFARLFKTPFQQLRIYVQAQNLFTITKYTGVDPEVASNGGNGDGNWVRGIDVGLYPSARTYLIGASIKF